MSPDELREYSYRPSWKNMALVILFFGFCAVFLGMKAASNVKPLSLFLVWDLSPQGATVFFWVIASVSGLFVTGGLFGIWRRLSRTQRIALDDEGLLLPKSAISNQEIRVPYSGVIGLSITSVAGERVMTIWLKNGTSHGISGSLLPTPRDFDEILETIRQHAPLGLG